MKELFKAEWLRFRTWAFAAAAVHVVVLGFMSRLMDLAQQSTFIYQIIGIVYVVVGMLLGLYQMGTYRRPNYWLNLLHRPLHRRHVALALCGAGAMALLLAIAVPIAVIAAWQELLTARVVDVRHWLIPVASLLIALCGYLAGAYAMLGNRRYSAAVVMLPILLLFSQAHGIGAIAVQLIVLSYLAVLVATVFRPELDVPPRGVAPVLATALPVQVGAYFLLWILGFGFELLWTALGQHPLNGPAPSPDGFIAATQAEPKDRLLAGIASSDDPEAALWREQVELSDVIALYPMRDLLRHQQLTNLQQPAEFSDPERSIRWVFSHDRMRFVGQGTRDGRAQGELGLGAQHREFPGPLLPFGNNILFSHGEAFQYDSEQQQVFPRIRLPKGEVFAVPPDAAGENVAVLSNRALYLYPGREASTMLDPLHPLLRIALPGAIGHLGSVEMIELLDGYLVSFMFTHGAWSGEAVPYQHVLRVDGEGNARQAGRRELAFDLPLAYTTRLWWLSPTLRELCLASQRLFAAPQPLGDAVAPTPPRYIMGLAFALSLLSLLAAIRLTHRQAHTPAARWSWVLGCGVIGVPALVSLWLLFPVHEQAHDLPDTVPAAA